MEVNEYRGIKVGDDIEVNVGHRTGEIMSVKSIEIPGTRTAWFTCVDCSGQEALYAQDEIILVRAG